MGLIVAILFDKISKGGQKVGYGLYNSLILVSYPLNLRHKYSCFVHYVTPINSIFIRQNTKKLSIRLCALTIKG